MNLIFDELKPHLPELMVDVFGNYVVQKALRRGSAKHVDSIVSAMENKILELSLSTYGCRVVRVVRAWSSRICFSDVSHSLQHAPRYEKYSEHQLTLLK